MSVADSSRPSPRRGRNGSSDGSLRCATAAARAAARRARRRAGSRRAREVSKISRCSDGRRLEQPRVDLRQRLVHGQLARARALEQRGELEQLQVADDRVRDVEVGVEAQLAEPPADLRRPSSAARRAAAGTSTAASRPGRTAPPRAAPTRRRPRRAPPPRTATAAAPRRGRCAPGRRARAARRARVIATCSSRRISAACARACGRGTRLLEQRVRDRLEVLPPRARHPRGSSARARRRARTRGPWRRASSSRARRAGARRRPPPPRAARRRRRRRSSARTRAPWPAARGARSRPRARRSAPGCAAARRPRWWPRTAAAGAARAARSAGGRTGRAAWSRARRGADAVAASGTSTIRSRASGGICGDSSAADSAATMSSLRRRAIWVTRARSIARSSTGGRASARTTAPASPGSTSSRSQASRSRTSARWKNAAAPDRWYGTARSSNATATAWPSARTERTSTHTSSGATSLARDQPLDVGRHGLRLRALGGAAPERDLAALVARRSASFSSRSSIGSTTARAAASTRAPRAVRDLEPDAPSRPATRRGSRARSWSPRRGSGGSPGRRRRTRVIPPCSATSSRSSRPWAKLASCSSSTSTWRKRRGQPRAHERALAQQPERLQDEVAEVERAGLVEQPVVGGEQRGELALARAVRVLGQPRRPRRVVVGGDQLVLERVDPRARSRRASRSGCRAGRGGAAAGRRCARAASRAGRRRRPAS